MDVRSVHHVAFAVSDLDEAVGTYERLFGAEVELRGRMEDQGVEAAYLRVGSGRVELMSALEEDTPSPVGQSGHLSWQWVVRSTTSVVGSPSGSAVRNR